MIRWILALVFALVLFTGVSSAQCLTGSFAFNAAPVQGFGVNAVGFNTNTIGFNAFGVNALGFNAGFGFRAATQPILIGVRQAQPLVRRQPPVVFVERRFPLLFRR